jgi:hypothetical protein
VATPAALQSISMSLKGARSRFCDELVAAGLEHAEVVRKLAPCVNRLDVRDLYLVVSAIAPVLTDFEGPSQPHHRQPNQDWLTPRVPSGSASSAN